MSQSHAKRLLKLWQYEIQRLTEVSRRCYEENGYDALSEAHVDAIARLSTARAIECRSFLTTQRCGLKPKGECL